MWRCRYAEARDKKTSSRDTLRCTKSAFPPVQNMADLNIEEYIIMDCEPMKGHLLNSLSELPSILPNSVHAMCTGRIKQCLSKEGKSAADCRTTAVHYC